MEEKYYDLCSLTNSNGLKIIGICPEYKAYKGMIAFDEEGNQYTVNKVTQWVKSAVIDTLMDATLAVEITRLYEKYWEQQNGEDENAYS